jgi:hypothetical protein
LPQLYRRKVEALERGLEGPDRAEAMDLIRSTIERIELRPRSGQKGLDAVLYGDLAAIMAACEATGAKSKRPWPKGHEGRHLPGVAGTRNHRELTLSCSV